MEKREWAEVTRPTAIIYRDMAETARSLYDSDPDLALEFLMSALEILLGNGTTTSNPLIREMLRPYNSSVSKSREMYDTKVASKLAQKAEERQYDKIVELHKQGMTQSQIGAELGYSQQKVSLYLMDIRKNYPEKLQE